MKFRYLGILILGHGEVKAEVGEQTLKVARKACLTIQYYDPKI